MPARRGRSLCGKGKRIKGIDCVNSTCKMLQSTIGAHAHAQLLHPV